MSTKQTKENPNPPLADALGSPIRSLRESLDRNPPTPEEAALLLNALSWHEDMVITNHANERVWLKPLIENGKRTGITDCCFADDPCSRHKEMANAGDK